MPEAIYDIAIIGGGINGAGIARDASGRGLKTLLIEQNDLASGTSSNSTKLIHGGLRYLEQKEFRLVRESLKEREVLLKSAPHIIWPLRIILPHTPALRSYFMVRLGLFLYDFMAGRRILKRSRSIKISGSEYGKPIIDGFNEAFIYSDCWVEDSRLVVLNCMDAKLHGATILTRTTCLSVSYDGDWNIILRDNRKGHTKKIKARAVVNATGPWINSFQKHVLGISGLKQVRTVKGSHIVVPKLFEHDHAYLLQQSDGRVVFAIPYEKKFTLLGTTEENYSGNPANAEISDYEIKYLCNSANSFFKKKITIDDIIWTYSGVRPLVEDGNENSSKISRDYILEKDGKHPNLLHIYSGKITTYRKLAEAAMVKLGYPGKSWTGKSTLPGGNLKNFNLFFHNLKKSYPWIPEDLLYRYARYYGTLCEKFIGHTKSVADLGGHLGDNVFEVELDYLTRFEWAETLDDILWRRTKLGLHVNLETKNNINLWLQKNLQ